MVKSNDLSPSNLLLFSAFLGEAEYVFQDDEFKVKYKSELRDAVVRAKERPCSLFSGYTFCLTKNIQPSVNVLSRIIKSSGGKVTSYCQAVSKSCIPKLLVNICHFLYLGLIP